MTEKAGRGDRQDRLGDHRFNHQVGQSIQLVLIQLDDGPVALDEPGELFFVEIIGPVVRVGPAAYDGELQHCVSQISDGRSDAGGIEIEQSGYFISGK